MYPVFLKLNGRKAVVIGAGPVAERKIGPLLDSGARISVVAPVATEGIKKLAANGKIRWNQRIFREEDLDGCMIVIAATDSTRVNASVYARAARRGQLINSVDDPENCNFYVPAIVNRHPLLVAVSTSGRAPFFAKLFRRFIEKKLYQGVGSDIEDLGRIRASVLADSAGLDQEQRSQRARDAQRMAAEKILERIDEA